MPFIRLRKCPSVPTWLNVFIRKGHWILLNSFPVSVETTVWFYCFVFITMVYYTGFHMLNPLCVPAVNPFCHGI